MFQCIVRQTVEEEESGKHGRLELVPKKKKVLLNHCVKFSCFAQYLRMQGQHQEREKTIEKHTL